ncbi:MAG: methyltransferase [Bacteroidetes bacterium]|nr:methyltransferase [Bacteroidota bacterium]MBT3934959.1 methyltransferase [Bacteroidota bacterium]MBT5990683.1 methyltransferase [Bacteroidota bacterium]MBT6834643.1 methyltransferase [Bacteroidota bacterium]MBT7039389.1 methyltransferase [Bacteroidota bacterium]
MNNKKDYFHFKQFSLRQTSSAMKVGIDGILLAGWTNAIACQYILDVGTGTGLLALLLAQKSTAQIDAIEINKQAYLEASYNISESAWSSRLQLFHTSFQDYVKNCFQLYDLIISNPPFYNETIKSKQQARNMARNSESLELAEMLSCSKKMMHANSRLSFIYPYSREKEIKQSCSELGFNINRICFVKPKPSKDYHRILLELSMVESETKESELIIEGEKHLDYSLEFKALTKDYYLNF